MARNLKAPPPPPTLESYDARLLAHGFDTYAEAWNIELRPGIRAAIADARAAAEAADTRGKAPELVTIGGREWTVAPHGATGGVRYVLRDDRCMVLIRAEGCEWGVSVRYLSRGLWEAGGLDARRDEVGAWLRDVSEARDEDAEPALSRFDYAFDFHAPAFTAEAGPALEERFLAPAHTKGCRWWQHGQTQTITIGLMPRLQVQVYDKGAEIIQASGKDWMGAVWAGGAGEPLADEDGRFRDVWRIELRFGGEYLKERRIRGYGAMRSRLSELLSAALVDRRLTVDDPRRVDLRPIHPLWWRAWEAAGRATTAPAVVRYTSLQREEYRSLLVTQLAGTLRSGAVAEDGKWTPETAEQIARDALTLAQSDPNRTAKERAARGRFRWLGDAH